jgi:sulfoxide reductase heme-binding subunit YedZ
VRHVRQPMLPTINKLLLHRWSKPTLWLLALAPFMYLLIAAPLDALGPNPAWVLTHQTGSWTLRFLCLTLAVTPLQQWTGLTALARFRRSLGLYAFFYGALHFLCYGWLDMGLVPADIWHDLYTRRFMMLGAIAFVLMTVLAATSFNGAIKALGGRRWKLLHKATYAIASLGVFHWYRIAKHDNLAEWSVYAIIILALLGWRVVRLVQARRRRRQATTKALAAGDPPGVHGPSHRLPQGTKETTRSTRFGKQ